MTLPLVAKMRTVLDHKVNISEEQRDSRNVFSTIALGDWLKAGNGRQHKIVATLMSKQASA